LVKVSKKAFVAGLQIIVANLNAPVTGPVFPIAHEFARHGVSVRTRIG
jgi:hypothetical protein